MCSLASERHDNMGGRCAGDMVSRVCIGVSQHVREWMA